MIHDELFTGFGIVWLITLLGLGIGWILNIIKFLGMLDGGVTARIVGFFLVPLGGVLGYF